MVKMSSMVWAPRSWTRLSVTALIACGVSMRLVSRYVAVTITSSRILASSSSADSARATEVDSSSVSAGTTSA